jgi:NTP pyrophosphatase (non-canonical NTP hydrolase)
LLACLAEECAEVEKNVLKALRFGLQDGYPGSGVTNAEAIADELRDLIAVAKILEHGGWLRKWTPNEADVIAKHTKIEKYMRYAAEQGALTEDTSNE